MDTTVQLEILQCLRAAAQPLRPQLIALAVGAHVDAIYDELGRLVRLGAARRDYGEPGVLRYAPVPRKASTASQPAPAEPAVTPHRLRPQQLLERPAPMAESVLAVMGDAPMRSRAITKAHGGISTHQTATALQVLRRRGAVQIIGGTTRKALWQRVTPMQQADA